MISGEHNIKLTKDEVIFIGAACTAVTLALVTGPKPHPADETIDEALELAKRILVGNPDVPKRIVEKIRQQVPAHIRDKVARDGIE